MNPILEEIYSTIIPSAPYIIAAYALMWLAILVYVFVVVRGLKKTEAQMAVLEEALAERSARAE
ncbi:hypothetical protein [Rubneribacter sp.]|nr:hypothetical protein [Candidatus Rubneribacter avistercoris]